VTGVVAFLRTRTAEIRRVPQSLHPGTSPPYRERRGLTRKIPTFRHDLATGIVQNVEPFFVELWMHIFRPRDRNVFPHERIFERPAPLARRGVHQPTLSVCQKNYRSRLKFRGRKLFR
jgi:hypothetical protein